MTRLKIFFTYLLPMIFFSCSDSPIGFDDYYNYPLEVGLTWTYNHTFQMTNFRPLDINNNYFPDTNIRSEVVKVLSEGKYTFGNGTNTFVLSQGSLSLSYLSKTYYISEPNALYRYAYTGGGVASPKTSTNLKFHFKGLYFNSICSLLNYFTEILQSHQDSIYIESPPSLVYKYPLTIGSKWNFVDNPVMKIDKEIISKEIISTPAGQFDAYVIKWSYKFNGQGNVRDSDITGMEYLSSEGLTKRTFFIKDIAVSLPTGTDIVGYIDIIDELILTNISKIHEK